MMSVQRLERQLWRAGWHLARIVGSHRQYHNQRGQLLTVAAHGSRVRPDVLKKVGCDVRRAERSRLWRY